MKEKILTYKTSFCYYLAAFALPVVIMAIILATQNIYPNSERTILASDGFHQYVIFATNLRNILHGDDSIFYAFTSGLGINFYALISYYLGSFLSPLYYFFNLEQMADAVYYISLAKFGLIGLSAYFSFTRLFKTVSRPLILTLSTSFALMSFTTSQLEINTWLDVYILVPLIILGFHYLFEGKGRWIYYLSLTFLFIQNYYFGYMMSLFLFLYFLVNLVTASSIKTALLKGLDFAFSSILAAISSAVMLLPTILDLTTHGEEFTEVSTWFTEATNAFDIFAKNMVGVYDTTKFGAIPMIYVGLFPLILAILFFTIKEIKWQVKTGYLLLLFLLVLSFYIQPLDLAWQGMHAPNMFLHRYSWLFSLLIVLLAGQSLPYIKQISLRQLLVPFGILVIGFSLTFVYREYYSYLTDISFILSFSFLLAYAILLVSFSKKQIPKSLFLGFTFFFCLFEIGLNTYYVVNSLGAEWVFPTREGYTRNMKSIENLVAETKKDNSDFYRTERLEAQTGNDSMKYNYNGISQFSSIRNTASSSTLDKLGFKSDGTNLNLRYQNNTLLMDSLFAVKYNLSTYDPDKYDFIYTGQEDTMSLYTNSNVSQLAVLTNGVYKDVDFTVNTLDNQTALINNLTGLNLDYFNRLNASLSDQNTTVLDNQITAKAASGSNSASTTFTVQVPAHTQLYVSVPNINFGNSTSKAVTTTVNGISKSHSTDNTFSFFDIGYFENEETVDITFSFPANESVTFDTPNFYALNTDNYQTAIDTLNAKKVNVTTKHNSVIASYSSDSDSSLFFTLPYDQGWTAKVNGKSVSIDKAQDGFMKVDVPAGDGQVVLNFVPNGFKEGAILSGIGIFIFNVYTIIISYITKYRKK
ncbi:YfhO family protein [Streptococcus dentiloxodontae]